MIDIPPVQRDVVITTIRVRPDAVDEFKTAIDRVTRESAKEGGVLSFYCMQHAQDPCRFEFLDVFVDDEAFSQHLGTPHIKEFSQQIASLLAGPAQIEHFTGLRAHSKL